MKYLLDTNSLSKNIINKASKRSDVFIIRDVLDEYVYSPEEETKFKSTGIDVIDLEQKHFEKLRDVMKKHGDNFSLIRLYTGKGTADVLILAYILAETEVQDTLFPEEYTIVTQDGELITVAKEYGINCINQF